MVDATAGTAPGPVRSLRALGHLRTAVPGLDVPDGVDRRLRAGLARRDPAVPALTLGRQRAH